MTRRDFVWTAAIAAGAASTSEPQLSLPIVRIINSRAKFTPAQRDRFWSSTWPEAVRDFARCGVRLDASDAKGEIKRSPGGRPVFTGLRHGVINLVLTDYIPLHWDNGRAIRGVATIHEGYHLCVVALKFAHSHQIPFLSVNTCVHELLHFLLGDVFVRGSEWLQSEQREFRTDWYATRLWLFHSGGDIRQHAGRDLERLHARHKEPVSTR